jgi:hypothetical protein
MKMHTNFSKKLFYINNLKKFVQKYFEEILWKKTKKNFAEKIFQKSPEQIKFKKSSKIGKKNKNVLETKIWTKN